ncbi:hypothetical protein N7457_008519 [Penicillium paradoxum]|uniref:uncharacterized protein n=1 Tax=Penicillium paradoxum TaxID=176176 RepID=UPI002548C388|nr:uncharacterized protein N7457_008519 [Penicillium paradoxum]KAJ5773623.1 hypothetical protein N7457_008519 [Penicillium paradoxum]
MGNTSSQPEPFPEIPDDFGDIVPETPRRKSSYSPEARRKKNKSGKLVSTASDALPSKIVPGNGDKTSPKSDPTMSKAAKRKRGTEQDLRQKTKKSRKSDNQVGAELLSQEDNSTSSAIGVQLPPSQPTPSQPTPSQPTPSQPELPRTKKPQRASKNDKGATAPTSPTSSRTRDMADAEKPSPVKELTAAKQTPPTDSPTPEGSVLSGGRIKGVRGSRTREKDNLKIGFYTPDEVQKIEAYKVNFCTMHGISSILFDEMVQHSERGGSGDFPVTSEVITKSDFWNEIYALVPDRDRRSVYRFMRRHFQASAQKAHDWSQEQDEELIELHAKHGAKWAYIGKLIGRSDDDVTQRWKNKLEHQGTMKQGAWSEEETNIFLKAVESSWITMKQMLSETAGKDFYELDERLVVWGNISKEMGHTRSRQQCADKWRKIVKQVMTTRANGQPDAVYDPKVAARKSANWNTRLEGQRKSSQYVKEDSDDEGTTATKTATPKRKRQRETEASPVPDPNAESNHEVPSEEDEADLPEPPKKAKKSKSKRKRTEELAAAPINEVPSSPATPKKTKEERKREKKERREKEMQEQLEQEAKEKEERDEKVARKSRKQKKKEEKQKRQEEEEDIAVEEAPSSDAEAPEPPKKNKKKSRKHAPGSSDSPAASAETSRSVVEASPSPASSDAHGSATEHDDADDQSEIDSDGGENDNSEVDIKHETDSDEL